MTHWAATFRPPWFEERDGESPQTSRTASLDAGLRRVPCVVFTSAERTWPSAATKASTTMPRFHCPRLSFSSHMTTTSPILIGSTLRNHFVLRVKVGRYSNTHLFQNVCFNCCTTCHFFWDSHFLGLRRFVRNWGNPIKMVRVNGSASILSTGMCVSGRELIKFSASINKLCNTSTCGAFSFNVNDSTFFTDCTMRSQAPPADGCKGVLNTHSILLRRHSRCKPCSMSNHCSLLAPMKFVPLSLLIRRGMPRRFTKFLKQSTTASVDKSFANSKWIALTVKHVNTATHRFSRRRPTATQTGPK